MTVQNSKPIALLLAIFSLFLFSACSGNRLYLPNTELRKGPANVSLTKESLTRLFPNLKGAEFDLNSISVWEYPDGKISNVWVQIHGDSIATSSIAGLTEISTPKDIEVGTHIHPRNFRTFSSSNVSDEYSKALIIVSKSGYNDVAMVWLQRK